VLRVLEVERSTYYAHVNRPQQTQETIHRAGRPAPGLSYTQDGKPTSDEQICEWIMELLAGEGANYGYRKLTVLLRRRHQLKINKKNPLALMSTWGLQSIPDFLIIMSFQYSALFLMRSVDFDNSLS
jgi:hypothetical protein